MAPNTASLPNLSSKLRKALDRIECLEINIFPFWASDIKDNVSFIELFRYASRVTITLDSSRTDVGELAKELALSVVATEFLSEIEVNGKQYGLVDVLPA
ncbi:hypothetical protein B0H10DRAFT_2213245 [Mycena sp. CBHHK59/15]|nr:hypothetical protein B0H10DRAFT_2213245 [Mycena sp. CBHHK59/15]